MTLVAPDHVESGTGRLLSRVTAEEQHAISGKYRFSVGDIVYSKIRPYLRKAILADFDGLCSADMYPLKPLPGVSPGYVFAVILGEHFSRYAEAVSARTGLPKINREELSGYQIAIPPTLREQEAIAEAISDTDAMIASLECLIAKKRGVKQGAMHELLTGKRRLPGFSREWETKFLSAIGTFFKGSGVKRDDAQSGALPCVRYGELYTRHHDLIREFHSWVSPAVAATARRVRRGDILFAGSGETKEEIGKCATLVNDCDAYAGGDIIVLRPHNGDSVFLGYYLNSPIIQREKASRGQGDAVVHISAASLAEIEVSLPGSDEQKAIATVLVDLDDELRSLEDRLAKALQIKQGMMQKLLTGRVRLA